jgi:GTP-binding protein HflX
MFSVGELQRTYRGKAKRDVEKEESPYPTAKPVERAIVVASMDVPADEQEDRLTEIRELLRTAGADVVDVLVQRRAVPNPRTYLGKGRLEDLIELVKRTKPDLVALEGDLTPSQQRILEDRLNTRVVDHTGLILDIFALHAHTAEGKLQVELAQLEYNYARQEGLWQHLERLGGGVGTRGPGETQLESDRRLLRNRMSVLRARLRDLERSRDVMRARRVASAVPRLALAGYTNAGKSSLMNALTGAGVNVNDALFETLDPTTRTFELDGTRFLLSDTVGFIRRLPHQLVEAFKSTLEETRDADLILHVADASEAEERRVAREGAVLEVLDEIGAGDVPRLLVLNKIDRVGLDDREALRYRHPGAAEISALTGEGLDELRARLIEFARSRLTPIEVLVPYRQGAIVSTIYSVGRDVEQEPGEEGTLMRALVPPAAAAKIHAALNGGAPPG